MCRMSCWMDADAVRRSGEPRGNRHLPAETREEHTLSAGRQEGQTH